MSAVTSAAPTAPTSRVPMVGVLRGLLIGEALGGLLLAVFLSLLASGMREFVGGEAGVVAEQNIRFAAGGAFLFAVLAAIASRGARRRRPWAWTLAAILQVVIAIGTGIAVLIAEWHPLYLVAFAIAAVVMVVLSTASVRNALGQG
jgi:uncharacterized membrane protein (DUF2068 family)